MQNDKLLPCPFCGDEVEFHPQEHHMNNFWNKNTIYCPTCDFMMEETSWFLLFKKWNTRKPMERIVEQLEKLADEANDNMYESYYDGKEDGIRESIEIVKAGGVSE